MTTSILRTRLAKAAAALAVVAVGASSLIATSGTAGADPQKANALVGVGSDTTQDVINAMAGFNNGINYVPIQGNTASRLQELVSWDATPPVGTNGCITVKTGFGAFPRPNGSSSGQRALSRSIDGSNWGPTTNASFPCAEAAKPIGGQIDFARSSAVPTAGLTGSDVLEYLPFAHDALSFGVIRKTGVATTSITFAQLVSLFTTAGPTTIGGVPTYACGIQSGSGTDSVWKTALGITDAQELVGTAACTNGAGFPTSGTGIVSGGRLQESNGAGLLAKANAADTVTPGSQVVVGFSVGNWIAQSNLVAKNDLNGTLIGTVPQWDANPPFSGTTPNIVPNQAFYNGPSGRDLYNVVSKSKLDGLGNEGLKSLFVNTNNRTLLDGTTTSGSATLTSATANFTAADTGKRVQGNGIPANTTATFVNATTITLSNNATLTNAGTLTFSVAGTGNNAAICQPVPQATILKFGFTDLGADQCGLRGITTGTRNGTF